MKIALCFYGQPRNVTESYDLIKSNIIDQNGIEDIFIHTWWRPEFKTKDYRVNTESGPFVHLREEDLQFLKSNYLPKKILIQNDKEVKFHNESLITSHIMPYASLDRIFPSFYSRFQTFKLLKEYELDKKIKYDNVCIIRTDTKVKIPIKISELDLSKINVNSIEWNPTNDKRYVSDFIIVGNRDLMETYADTYNYLPKMAKIISQFKDDNRFFAEQISGTYLTQNNIDVTNSFNTRNEICLIRHEI